MRSVEVALQASEHTSSPNPGTKQDYAGLDLIRFAAAILVAGYHIFIWWWVFLGDSGSGAVSALREAGSSLSFPFRWGYVGVPIFFVLSGFVIAFTADGRSAGAFIRSRALRLYPGAWVCATATLLLSHWGEPEAIGGWVRSVTLYPLGPWISGAYWTLAVEIAFYSLIALALKYRVSLRSVATALSVWGIGYWALVGAYRVGGEPLHSLAGMVINSPIAILILLPNGCLFALGMLMWSLTRPGARHLHRYLLAPVTLACIFSLLPPGAVTPDTAMPALLWMTMIGLMAAAIAFNDHISRAFAPWRPAIRTLGLLTYPLYLVHEDIGRDAALQLLRIVPPLFALLLAFVGVVALALLLLSVERSVRGILQNGLPSKLTRIPAA